MSRSFRDSYRRTFDLLKEHKTAVLLMCAFLYVIYLGMMISQQAGILIVYILAFLGAAAIAGGVYIATLGGGFTVLGIVVVILGVFILLLMLAAYLAFMILVGSFNFGLQIYIAELLLRLKMGGKMEWNGIWDELRTDWKHLLKRGFRLFMRYLLWVLVLVVVLDLLMGGVIAAFILLMVQMEPSGQLFTVSLLVMIVFSVLISILMIVVITLLWYIVDAAAVRMAEGRDARTSLNHGLRDVRYHIPGVLRYLAGVFALMLAVTIFFPLAFIIQPLMPILTKSFIIANRDLFYE